MKNEFISTVSHELRTPSDFHPRRLSASVSSGVLGPLALQVGQAHDPTSRPRTASAWSNLVSDILDIE